MRVLRLDAGVKLHRRVLVQVELEQRARLAHGLVHLHTRVERVEWEEGRVGLDWVEKRARGWL